MVKIGSTLNRVEHTAFICFEDLSVGLDGNRDGATLECGLDLSRAVGKHVLKACGLHIPLFRGIAIAFICVVWVFGFEVHRVDLSVFEGIVHPTTAASIVAEVLGAVNELLFGERILSASLDGVA